MKLLDIPGVGARMRDRLIEYYGSEESALEAVRNGDVASLLKVMSERQATSMAQWATARRYGVAPGDLLATDEAVRIYQMLIQRIAKHAHTDYARLKLGLMFPSSSKELIDVNRKFSELSMEWARKLEGQRMDDLLTNIRPLKEKTPARVRDRAVVAGSAEVLNKLKSLGLDRLIDVIVAESARELADAASGYSHVCVVGRVEYHQGLDVEQAECLDEWYLVPESILSYYSDNLDALLSAIEASKLLSALGIATFEGLEEMERLLLKLASGEGDEWKILAGQIQALDGCVKEAADWANKELKKRMESRSVTLAGGDLLQALGRGEGVRELFQVQMRSVFQEVLNEARAQASSKLGLKGPDAARLDEIFDSDVQYPLEMDRQALHRFGQDLRTRLESRSLHSRRELARGLSEMRKDAEEMVAKLLQFDLSWAVGKFATSEGLSLPEIVDEVCLGFDDGKNLFLESPEPVSYSVGDTGMADHPERIVLLSGVNSGGKTSLLDLISQVLILAQMGLPVPARRCRLCLFQELYYFTKSRGTLSAGAFETAMRKFAVVENSQRKMVLADELEAITEPGASAKIIACMLDELDQKGSAAIFVSHLAEEVKRFSKSPVRVDGIEADGLDAENNLVVRRTPRYNYLAKSTPELILDRLVRTTSGPEHDFYSRLLSRFR